jgi:dolichol-phosphate mannosyltransferase
MFDRTIILIPTLNEKENLEKLIPAVFGLMPDISILVVDDNSSDGTQELAEKLKQKYGNLFILTRTSNYGYGRSSIDGFKWALNKNYDFFVTMDADFSHDFNTVPALLKDLENYDISVGSRYVQGGGIKNWSFFRQMLSKFANFYVKTILALPIMDTTTGFNAYRADALRKINLEDINSDGYAFLVELKYRLFKVGCSVVEYPILFSERREGESKMSSKIIWEAVKLPWKLKSS